MNSYDVLPESQEICPRVDRHGALGSDDLVDGFVVHNDGLKKWERLWQVCILHKLLISLHDDDFGLAVIGDIMASLGGVGGVDSCSNAPSKNTSGVGDEPLWLFQYKAVMKIIIKAYLL